MFDDTIDLAIVITYLLYSVSPQEDSICEVDI